MPRPHRVRLRIRRELRPGLVDSRLFVDGQRIPDQRHRDHVGGTGFSAAGSLGTGGVPGLLIDDSGDVTALDLSVTGSMSVAGLNVTAAGVTIAYQAGGSLTSGVFEIVSGSVTVGSCRQPVNFKGHSAADTPGFVLPATR